MNREQFLENFKEKTKAEIAKLGYRKYFYQFNELEKERFAKEMKDIDMYFGSEFGVTVYPVYGTLLGMMRDGDFIPWDTDVDLAYLSKYHTRVEVLREFNEICTYLAMNGLLLKKIPTASHIHIYSPLKGLKLDMWISWIDENGKYHLVWTVWGDESKEILLPWRMIEFKGQTFPLMNNAKRFLDIHYGNWQTDYIDGTQEVWALRKPKFELESWRE